VARRGEFPALGRALDRVLPRVRRDIQTRVLDALTDNLHAVAMTTLLQVFAGAYVTGVQVGWLVHGAILGAPLNMSPREVRAWRDRAMRHGHLIANRVRVIAEREPTVAELRQHIVKAGESSVWTGQDDAGEHVATLAEAAWKEWVRAWPRTEHRDHHDALEGVVIPEEDHFTLPGGANAGAQVYGPRDWDAVPDPGEWLNCGHALAYHRDVTEEDLERTRRGVGVVYRPPTRSAVYAAR